MAVFQDLPSEIIDHICRYLTPSETKFAPSRQALSSLCLVSQNCKKVAQPHLYRRMEIRDSHLVPLTNALVAFPDLATLIRTATFKIYETSESWTNKTTSYFTKYAQKERIYDRKVLKSYKRHKDRDIALVVLLIEILLLKLNKTKAVVIKWNLGGEPEFFATTKLRDRNTRILPALQTLRIEDEDGDLNLGMTNTILRLSGANVLIAEGFTSFMSEIPISSYPSLQELRLFLCDEMPKYSLLAFIKNCPNLQVFKYFSGDFTRTKRSQNYYYDPLLAKEVVSALDPAKNTLRHLSLSVDRWADKESIGSLRRFTILEHLEINANDLASIKADEAEQDTDSDSDEDIEANFWDALDNEDEDDNDDGDTDEDSDLDTEGDYSDEEYLIDGYMTSDTEDSCSDEDENDSEWTDEDTDSTTSSQVLSDLVVTVKLNDEESKKPESKQTCQPFVQKLPRSLKTLRIEHIPELSYSIEDELMRLAAEAKDELPELESVTMEGMSERVERMFANTRIQCLDISRGNCWWMGQKRTKDW